VSAPIPDIETGGRLTIDLSAIQSNYTLLRERAANSECAAVVKADAYGLGAPRVARALADIGARTFFVAHVFEARAVREAVPGAAIYVLNGLTHGAAPAYREIGARPVLGSFAEIDEWTAFARAQNIPGDAAIHVDTGMNRLGIAVEEAASIGGRLAARALGFRAALVMSHLACADEPSHPLNERQLVAFEKVIKFFPGVHASLANSAATLTGGGYHFELCRPGIALYGGNPLANAPSPLKPVVRLETHIVQIRAAEAGEKVGYGATQTLTRASRLAILSLGYADGFLRAAGSSDLRHGASVIIAGRKCPLVGRVSMDLVAADVTDVPQGKAARGGFATVLGDGITIDDLAEAAGTIGYEILTRLGARFTRTYIG
jgi:alanine racemase